MGVVQIMPDMVTSPASAPSDAGELAAKVRELVNLDASELRLRWRRLLRIPPPDHLPRGLFARLLAYRLQARRSGDLDPGTARYLDRIARDSARRRASWLDGERASKAPPPIPPAAARSLKTGTLLVREFAGRTHVVTVSEQGFAFDGRVYASLSGIARLITGTRWNGPRFFGLRDRIAGRVSTAEAVAR